MIHSIPASSKNQPFSVGVALSIKWPPGHFMLNLPIGHILLYRPFVLAKKARSVSCGLFLCDSR